MVKVISKTKHPYDFVWGSGDPAYIWERKEEQGISVPVCYSYHAWLNPLFGIDYKKPLEVYTLFIGEESYCFGFYSLEYLGFCKELFNKNNFIGVPQKSNTWDDHVKSTKEKRQKIRNLFDSPIVLFGKNTAITDLDFSREDKLYKFIINTFDLSPEKIAQQIEHWFANRSIRLMDKADPQSDKEKIVSHGFDKKQSFRHRMEN